MFELDLEFSLQHGTNYTLNRLKIDDYFKSVKYADEAGYDAAFIMDHINHTPPKGEVPSSMAILGYAASLAKNIKLGSGVTDPLRRHPSQIALDSLTMQRLTNNKFILGIGAGEGMNYNDYGIKWDKIFGRFKEGIEVIKLLWKSAQSRKLTADYSGKYYNLEKAKLQ